MVDRRVRGLFAVEHAQAAIETLLPQIVQGVVQVRERILAHVAPFYGDFESGQAEDHVAAVTENLHRPELRERRGGARPAIVEPRRLVHDHVRDATATKRVPCGHRVRWHIRQRQCQQSVVRRKETAIPVEEPRVMNDGIVDRTDVVVRLTER